ncbi:GntP family permease [Garciella nitratireducens]|uniref:Gluconate:H+ symporter, GntP family n=1 Tax=Garciella nitratireducens DSM 15102 TaxID=1121911 RepID=A0A1T4PMP9_9FIRM|nr:gluconate:H+ symporter [Garciella nitratireducens]SJZ92823.1 gluconate:H+ symporter, GntP family [Garciella nitratireducens DSM 15102]
MTAQTQMLIGLAVGLIILLFMIMRTKIHTFLALIIATVFIGIIGGVPYEDIVVSITGGFGGTLGNIGIIIGLGVMMGSLFEASGAAKTMARTFLKILGKGKEEIAMAATGFLVSIPIFCDSGFVILFPLAKALSKQTKKSVISLGVSLAAGLVITHTMVPPTPGPVGVAGIFDISVGTFMLWGIVIAVPMAVAGIFYAKYIGKKIYQIPDESGEGWIRPENLMEINTFTENFGEENLPGVVISFAPIVVPIFLILLNNVFKVLGMGGGWIDFVLFLGQPIIAVAIGTLVAIVGLTKGLTRKETLDEMEKGITSAGIIILVTGGGGALGQIIKDSGVGEYIAQIISKTGLPAILLPFLISTLLRFIQGSGTVAMLTSASITAPILASLGANPLFGALSACVGSLFFSYFNDSFFHVVTRTMGLTEAKEQMQAWSITTTIAWGVGFGMILILNGIFG